MLLPTAPFSAPPADAPASRRAAPVRVLGGVALTSVAVIPLVDAPSVGGWLVATALAAGAVAILPADRPRQRDVGQLEPDLTQSDAALSKDELLSEDELTERLRALHDVHVEEANMALAEGREDLVRESSERYTHAALRLLTSAHPAT